MILEQEINIFLESVIVHERAELEDRLALDWLRADILSSLKSPSAVAHKPRDVGRAAAGDILTIRAFE